MDGHVVLSRQLAESGHYPAIDIEASISRAMTALVNTLHFQQVQQVKQWLASYQRNRDLLSVGAYAASSDPLLDQAIAHYPQLESYLRQDVSQRCNYVQSCQQLSSLFTPPSTA
ncbi:hypothetical protein BG74_04310 [Sodalis-like endosymbiont of Proechinophthirus fluctus]|nr:hypothetical protein BG74_04310 [Sodalis-like endosymbiont of Proechinophthirus fluctus]